MHLHCIHFLLCTDVLGQQIDWFGYTDGTAMTMINNLQNQRQKNRESYKMERGGGEKTVIFYITTEEHF
jgi:hypothetical protein